MCVCVCVSVCVWDGWRERWGDRDVKEERWSDSRGDVRRLSDGKNRHVLFQLDENVFNGAEKYFDEIPFK